jgi:NADPH:quinone reductase-like Zn-dependent oxidoreductase
MKAAICRHYGPPAVVTVEEWPDPLPRAGEVLIAIKAAGLTSADARIRAARAPAGFGLLIRLAFGLTGPRQPILGREFSGHVVALGAGVSQVRLGQAVFGVTDGMRLGAHAERVAVRADGLLYPRPAGLSETEAAAFFFGGLTAADFLLDQCALQPGERVLIVGATGAVGSAAVQIARHIGAHVTVLRRQAYLELAGKLGADHLLDDRPGCAMESFDVILDVPGVLPKGLAKLAPGGRLGLVTASLWQVVGAMLWPNRGRGRRVCARPIKETPEAMARLIALYTAGAYRPLMGETFALADIVRAYAAADSGHKRGNVTLWMP